MIFISHTAADRPFAVAIDTAIKGLLGSESLAEIHYSTSAEMGPQGGEAWRQWIDLQIVEARTVIVVVSPDAIGKPWLLWEAGACHGAALMSPRAGRAAGAPGDGSPAPPASRLLVGVALGLAEAECPDPLRGAQIVPGLDRDRMEQLFHRVLVNDQAGLDLYKIGSRMSRVLDGYLASVREALLKMPSLVNEANVQDWLSRLEEWTRSQRSSELAGFERWMALAFGREGDAGALPIDVRLHRRLGELYLNRGDVVRAVAQLELARRAAPRDVYVLRPLGQAYLKHYFSQTDDGARASLKNRVQALLNAIEELDPEAFITTPEAAALRAKYERLVLGNHAKAIEIFRTALDHNPDSYYLADVLGQTQLEFGEPDEARKTYEQALAILDRLVEINVWTCATGATAHLVLGNREEARRRLGMLADLRPPPARGEIQSIVEGLRHVAGRLKLAEPEIDDLVRLVRELGPG